MKIQSCIKATSVAEAVLQELRQGKYETVVVTIPVEIDNLQAVKALPILIRDGSLPVVVTGTATVDLKITSVKIPFEKRKVVGI